MKLTPEDLDTLIVSDFDKRAGINNSSSGSADPVLKRMMEKCGDITSFSDKVAQGGQFSVFASLPAVSASVSSVVTASTSALVDFLKFSTAEDVFPSDVKDWSFIEDSLDGLFARIDEAIAANAGSAKKRRIELTTDNSMALESRPQDAWKDVTDNYRKSFVPKIAEKPHAIEPLDPLLVNAQVDPSVVPSGFEFSNVYEHEIRQCLQTVSGEIEQIKSLHEIVEVSDLKSTDLVYVDSIEKLDAMIEDVMRSGEMAIDLEHHDVRSYRGFTCLIQVSTRSTDYIVDPFPLFHVLGPRLNRVTTDPRIRKVLHGADMDIQWLQRDFGVYIVNMFDTGQAARVVGLAGGFGLANLLDTFCKVKTNKRFQMSDWRVRPLSKDMLQYARMDTHYLLYIRDRIENLLLGLGSGTVGLVTAYGRKMLTQVMEKSFGISLKVWKDSHCESADYMCLKSSALKVGQIRSNPKSMAVLQNLLVWRDNKAKKLDESRNYVLTNGACLRLANLMPTAVPQILRIVTQESSSMNPSMRIGSDEADEILAAIQSAISEVEAAATPVASPSKMDVDQADLATLSRRRSSSVVQAGGAFAQRLSREGSRRSSITPIASSVGSQQSPLFQLFSAEPMAEVSEKHQQVLEELTKEYTECPAILADDFEAFKAGVPTVESIEAEAAAMADAIAAVPFGSEFVSFNTSVSGKNTQPEVDADGLPLTVREQRKRAPETSAGPKKKQRKSDAKQTAAQKALEFIEEELSLKKR